MVEPHAAPAFEPAPRALQIAKLALAWSVIAGGFVALAASLLFALGAARAEPATAGYAADPVASAQAAPAQGPDAQS